MKAFITPTYTFTPGASGAGTVDLSGISGFNIKRLVAIINQTKNVIIYSAAVPSFKYVSVAGTVVTLFADTSLHSSSDDLQVIYEEVGQKASASSHPVVLSSEQEALINDLEANQVLGLGLVGALNESAPASDTASSGLNGRLQRIAQRVSSLISLFPTTLGQKTKANSLAVAIASDQDALATKNSTAALTGSAAALNGFPIVASDLSGYKSLSVQLSGTFVATVSFQASNDNTNWFSVLAHNTGNNAAAPSSTTTTTGLYKVPVEFKFFRVQLTSYTSGAVQADALASASPNVDLAAKQVAQSGTWSVNTTASSVAGTITSAQITVGTTAVRATVAGTAPNAARKLLLIKPSKNNSGAIYYGSSTVTTSNGMEIIGPDAREFDFDAGDYFLISDTAGQTVELIEKV